MTRAGGRTPASIIIPCHDDGALVEVAIRSAIAQPGCEVIVVNDGSDEATTEALRAFSKRMPFALLEQPNTGLAGARMAGVRAASAPIIIPLDADDRLPEGVAAELVATLANPCVGAAWGDVEVFGRRRVLIPRARTLDPYRISYLNELPVSGSAIRTHLLLESGGWSLDGGYADWDLWMALAERGVAGRHIGRVSLYYQDQDPRMYRRSLRRHNERLRTLEARHPELIAMRRRNRRQSPTPRALAGAWWLARRMPLLSGPARLRASAGASVLLEPRMRRVRLEGTLPADLAALEATTS